MAQARQAATVPANEDHVVYPKVLEVTDEAQIEQMAVWTAEMFGHLDLIVNHAGINPKDYSDKKRMAKAFCLHDENEHPW